MQMRDLFSQKGGNDLNKEQAVGVLRHFKFHRKAIASQEMTKLRSELRKATLSP